MPRRDGGSTRVDPGSKLIRTSHIHPRDPPMPRSNATTAEEYLQELPEDRREVVARMREAILRHLPSGYQEALRWGMLSYEIPLERYPDTYNGQPLGCVALARAEEPLRALPHGAQHGPGADDAAGGGVPAEGKKLDMGKACLRFRKLEDLPLVVGRTIESTPPEELIRLYEESRRK